MPVYPDKMGQLPHPQTQPHQPHPTTGLSVRQAVGQSTRGATSWAAVGREVDLQRDGLSINMGNVNLAPLTDLVFLESLAADVQGKVVRVHNSSDEVQVAGQQLVELVRDEHLSHVELEAALLLLCHGRYVPSSHHHAK